MLVAILAFKKLAIAGAIAVIALLKKLFDCRKATVPPPLPPEATQLQVRERTLRRAAGTG